MGMDTHLLVNHLVLGTLTLAWVVWLPLAVSATIASMRARPPWERWVLWAVAASALVLRLAAPGVPHDINSRTDDLYATVGDLGWLYPHGLVALFRLLGAIGLAVDDGVVFTGVALAGAASVPLLDGVVRDLGGGTVARAAAMAALMTLGLHVRYSHTDAPQILEALLVLVAVGPLIRGAPPRPFDMLFVGLSLGLAAAQRPEALAVPILLLAWAAAIGRRWPTRAVLAVLALVVVVALPDFVLMWIASGGSLDRLGGGPFSHGLITHGVRHLATWNTTFVPAGIGALVMLASGGRTTARTALATLALLVALGSLVPNTWWSIAPSASWCIARHQLRVLTWTAILAGLGAEAVADRLVRWAPSIPARVVQAACVTFVLAASATSLPDAYAPTTLTDEYAFVRAHLAEIPDDCVITSSRPYGDHGFMLSPHLSSQVGRRHLWTDLGEWPADRRCVVYYRASICTAVSFSQADQDRCAAFEKAHRLVPVVEAGITDRGWLWERYGGAPVRIGFYNVEGVTEAVAPGGAPSPAEAADVPSSAPPPP